MTKKVYQPSDENKFFPLLIAALIIIALAVGSLVFSLVKVDDPQELIVNPDSTAVPSGPPGVPVPSGPPPSQ